MLRVTNNCTLLIDVLLFIMYIYTYDYYRFIILIYVFDLCMYTAHFIEWMKLMKPLFENDYQYKVDESKRPKKSSKKLSLSFKSLEID